MRICDFGLSRPVAEHSPDDDAYMGEENLSRYSCIQLPTQTTLCIIFLHPSTYFPELLII